MNRSCTSVVNTAKKVQQIRNFKYSLQDIFTGRLIIDIRELAKSQIKLNSYGFLDMVDHFFPKKRWHSVEEIAKLE